MLVEGLKHDVCDDHWDWQSENVDGAEEPEYALPVGDSALFGWAEAWVVLNHFSGAEERAPEDYQEYKANGTYNCSLYALILMELVVLFAVVDH